MWDNAYCPHGTKIHNIIIQKITENVNSKDVRFIQNV